MTQKLVKTALESRASAPGALLAAALLVPLSNPAGATGFFVPQQGVHGVGRANAGGSAIASSPATLFYNPAAATELWNTRGRAGATTCTSDGDTRIAINAHLISPQIRFRDTGTTASTPLTGFAPVPVGGGDGGDPVPATPLGSVFVAHRLRECRWVVGLAVTTPFGLKAAYDAGWFGRYDSQSAELRTINAAPTFALRINERFSIGAGVDVQFADAELSNALPDTLRPGGPSPDTDGLAILKGDDTSVGFNLGAHWRASEGTRVGLHYRSEMRHGLDGAASVSGLGGPLAAANGTQAASVDLDLPAIVSLGVAHDMGRWTLLGEAQWFGWSSFDEVRVKLPAPSSDQVRTAAYRDTFAFSVGLEHRTTERFDVRAGVSLDRTPTVDEYRDTLTPDGNRVWYSVGASYRPRSHRRLAIDFSATHVRLDDGPVNLTREFYSATPGAGSVAMRGLAESDITTYSVGIRLRAN